MTEELLTRQAARKVIDDISDIDRGVWVGKIDHLISQILDVRIEEFVEKIDEVLYGESHVSVKHIMLVVCDEYGIDAASLVDPRRFREVVEPRQVCFWIIRNNRATSKLTYAHVGKIFGGKNHATVMHGIKAVNGYIETDRDFRERLMMLLLKLGISTKWDGKELNITRYEDVID